jgi:hypothetical protein
MLGQHRRTEVATDTRLRSNRRGARRRFTIAAALTLTLVGGACAKAADGPDAAIDVEVGDFAATPEYLAGVADATDGLTYRMSMDMTMAVEAEGESLDMGGTLMTGEVEGERSTMTLDMGELFSDIAADAPADESMPEEFLDEDLTMEMVTDGSTLYMRAPFFAAIVEMALDTGASPDDLGPLGDLADLGDRWGRIDLAEMSPSQVASAAGAQSSDPRAFLDMVTRGTDVHELGSETIDGVETRGLGATVTYGDMIEAQGMDADDLREQMSPGDDQHAETFDGLLDAIFAMEMPVEVWVDDDDRVRRITLDMDMTRALGAAAEGAGEDLGDGGMSIAMVMDFFDYGDESIEVEVPTDSVDITDDYLALIDGGGLDAGTGGSVLGST